MKNDIHTCYLLHGGLSEMPYMVYRLSVGGLAPYRGLVPFLKRAPKRDAEQCAFLIRETAAFHRPSFLGMAGFN